MKRIASALMLVFAVSFAFRPPAVAEDDDAAFDADVRALLDVTGAFKMGMQMADGIVGPLARMHPQIPRAFWTEMTKRFKKDVLYDAMIPIYRRHLSHADVKALLTFYQTPSGKRIIETMPAILSESTAAGQVIGRKIVEDMMGEAKRRGYEI